MLNLQHHLRTTTSFLDKATLDKTVAGAAFVLLIAACSAGGTSTAAPTSATTATATPSSAPPSNTAAPSTAAQDTATPNTATSDTLTDCSPGVPFDEDLRVDSAIYGTSERVRLHITPCIGDANTPLPILYLLHGAAADETQWVAIGGLDEADKFVQAGILPPSIIVIPDAAPAYVGCSDCSVALATHLLDEIEPVVNAIHPVDTTRRAIGGISRGGGLALEIAGFNVDKFVAVGGHSAVNADPDALANLAATGVPVSLDAGNEDGLAAAARDMATALRDAGGDVTLVLGEGGHDRIYWATNLPDYYAFYGDHLQPR